MANHKSAQFLDFALSRRGDLVQCPATGERGLAAMGAGRFVQYASYSSLVPKGLTWPKPLTGRPLGQGRLPPSCACLKLTRSSVQDDPKPDGRSLFKPQHLVVTRVAEIAKSTSSEHVGYACNHGTNAL